MIRTVQTDENIFNLLYYGFIVGGQNRAKEQNGGSRSRVYLERDIHKAFQKVAERGENDLGWKYASGNLSFTQVEYEYIDKCLDSVDWATLKAVEIADAFDAWSAADKELG